MARWIVSAAALALLAIGLCDALSKEASEVAGWRMDEQFLQQLMDLEKDLQYEPEQQVCEHLEKRMRDALSDSKYFGSNIRHIVDMLQSQVEHHGLQNDARPLMAILAHCVDTAANSHQPQPPQSSEPEVPVNLPTNAIQQPAETRSPASGEPKEWAKMPSLGPAEVKKSDSLQSLPSDKPKLSASNTPTLVKPSIEPVTPPVSIATETSYDASQEPPEVTLRRLDLSLLSKVRQETRNKPLEKRCSIFEEKLRSMLDETPLADADTGDLFNQVAEILRNRELPFRNNQPFLQALEECISKLPELQGQVDSGSQTPKRQVIAPPSPQAGPAARPGSQTLQDDHPIQLAKEEFNKVKENVKDFGTDLYQKKSFKLPSDDQQETQHVGLGTSTESAPINQARSEHGQDQTENLEEVQEEQHYDEHDGQNPEENYHVDDSDVDPDDDDDMMVGGQTNYVHGNEDNFLLEGDDESRVEPYSEHEAGHVPYELNRKDVSTESELEEVESNDGDHSDQESVVDQPNEQQTENPQQDPAHMLQLRLEHEMRQNKWLRDQLSNGQTKEYKLIDEINQLKSALETAKAAAASKPSPPPPTKPQVEPKSASELIKEAQFSELKRLYEQSSAREAELNKKLAETVKRVAELESQLKSSQQTPQATNDKPEPQMNGEEDAEDDDDDDEPAKQQVSNQDTNRGLDKASDSQETSTDQQVGASGEKVESNPIKLAKKLAEKFTSVDDQEARCQKYFMLFTHRSHQFDSNLVDTIAKASIPIDGHPEMHEPSYYEIMRQFADLLSKSDDKKTRLIGKEVGLCANLKPEQSEPVQQPQQPNSGSYRVPVHRVQSWPPSNGWEPAPVRRVSSSAYSSQQNGVSTVWASAEHEGHPMGYNQRMRPQIPPIPPMPQMPQMAQMPQMPQMLKMPQLGPTPRL